MNWQEAVEASKTHTDLYLGPDSRWYCMKCVADAYHEHSK